MKVNCILIVTEGRLSPKSCRVCGVEAQISVCQSMSLGVDLVQLVGRAGVRIERVPLVSLQLVVEVACCDTLLIVLLGS